METNVISNVVIVIKTLSYTGADPGFSFGGGAPMSDMGVFWQKCMQKQKNWVPLGRGRDWHLGMGVEPGAPPGSANDTNQVFGKINY